MKKFAWFFPVSAGILWGSVGIFIRSLSGYGMDTATIVGSRTMISVILMLIGIAVIDKSQLKIRLKDLWIFVLASWLGMLGVCDALPCGTAFLEPPQLPLPWLNDRRANRPNICGTP